MSKVIRARSANLRKSGIGKTATAVNVARVLQVKGYKALLADLEHASNAAVSLGINPFNLTQFANTSFAHVEPQPQEITVKIECDFSKKLQSWGAKNV
jgi:cellulose biosynthesis protein BcsQ